MLCVGGVKSGPERRRRSFLSQLLPLLLNRGGGGGGGGVGHRLDAADDHQAVSAVVVLGSLWRPGDSPILWTRGGRTLVWF